VGKAGLVWLERTDSFHSDPLRSQINRIERKAIFSAKQIPALTFASRERKNQKKATQTKNHTQPQKEIVPSTFSSDLGLASTKSQSN
jgi:hypothetical protein